MNIETKYLAEVGKFFANATPDNQKGIEELEKADLDFWRENDSETYQRISKTYE